MKIQMTFGELNAKASYLGAKKAKDAQIVQYTANFEREVKKLPLSQ